MAFAASARDGAIVEMNIIPLADVLLVLLIIFMVTAPTPAHPLNIDLPHAVPQPPPPSEPLHLRIDAAGALMLQGAEVSLPVLAQQLQNEGRQMPAQQHVLQIDVAADADYGMLAKVLAEAKNAGLQKIGFADTPK